MNTKILGSSAFILGTFLSQLFSAQTTILEPLINVPSFMQEVVTNDKAKTKEAIALQNVLTLKECARALSQQSLDAYKQHLRARIPFIVAITDEKGGRFILYKPQANPEEAKPVPPIYGLAKSTMLSTFATYECVARFVENSETDTSWTSPLRVLRTQIQTALDSLNTLQLTPDDRALFQSHLSKNLDFIDASLSKKGVQYLDLENYVRGVEFEIDKLIQLQARTQVLHWMNALADWKDDLGKEWDNAYAIVQTSYEARENNPLYNILVQFMGERAINDKLLLLETSSESPDELMKELAKIIANRARNKVFFDSYYTGISDLYNEETRRVIENRLEGTKQKAILPELAPPNSHLWPWKVGSPPPQ